MRAFAICSILAVAACAPGKETSESAAAGGIDSVTQGADTTAARVGADSVGRVLADSTSRPARGTAAKDISVTSTSAAIRVDSAVRRDSIIGRDSAFGPKFRIDSTGKLVPIRRP